MKPPRHSAPDAALPLAVLAGLLAAWTWWWHHSLAATRRADAPKESWEQVKDRYPLAQELAAPPAFSPEMAQTVLGANPFSPQRRLAPVPAPGQSPETSEPAAPYFLYKGRIDLGQRSRAIVEELPAHKTHFLEVGQEVAGFKVLDIAQNRVVLSDLRTHEEVVVSLVPPGKSGAAP